MSATLRSPTPGGRGEGPGHRVVVTGLGTVTSIGIGVRSFLEGLREGYERSVFGFPGRAFDTA